MRQRPIPPKRPLVNWASFSTENRLRGGDTAGHKEKGVLQVFFEIDKILT